MRRHFLGIGLCLLFAGSACFADTRERLQIATGDWPPYVSAAMPNHGLLGSLIERTAARMGVAVEWRMVSWPLVERLVADGVVMAGLPYVQTPERSARYDFSEAIYQDRSVLFHLKGSDASKQPPKTFADLPRYRIASPHGYWWESALQRAKGEVIYTNDEAAAFKVLAANRVDFVPQDELVGLTVINTALPGLRDKFAYMPMPVEMDGVPRHGLHVILSRWHKDTPLRLRFEAALADELRSGQVNRDVEAWIRAQRSR
ncbi:ABC transporter substrate-binding protein [Chitinimonas sp. BJYL2]|uniref:substrate-binding periplasmic protein n=1 Tax=Chitinimonas sp. BJYL2 TaxID=2976696 RepID=UPI0022B3E9D5|nr:transporter substrate-binding domain-containing protein [Chitinimonas sp. BJYL2]